MYGHRSGPHIQADICLPASPACKTFMGLIEPCSYTPTGQPPFGIKKSYCREWDWPRLAQRHTLCKPRCLQVELVQAGTFNIWVEASNTLPHVIPVRSRIQEFCLSPSTPFRLSFERVFSLPPPPLRRPRTEVSSITRDPPFRSPFTIRTMPQGGKVVGAENPTIPDNPPSPLTDTVAMNPEHCLPPDTKDHPADNGPSNSGNSLCTLTEINVALLMS